jgi:hypothetical protein
LADITIDNDIVWVEATTKGDMLCPHCDKKLIVGMAGISPYGYCVGCDKYFIGKKKCSKCNEIYETWQWHECKEVKIIT